TLLDAAPGSTAETRRAVHRQLARVLRRVGQLPRAIAALEAVVAEFPDDRRAQRGLQVLRRRLEGLDAKAGSDGGAASGASGVLAKLPTRKAGVQAAAVWDEDSDYREETLVDSASGAPGEPSFEPRENTAVAFPALSEPEPREKTAVAFPTVPPMLDVPWGEPGSKSAREVPSFEARPTVAGMPVVGVASSSPPPEARPTAVAMPAVGAASRPPSPEARPPVVARPAGGVASSTPAPEARPTVVEMPAIGAASSSPPPEARPTVVEMPAIGAASSTNHPESHRTAVEMPAVGDAASPASPTQRSGPVVKQENLSVPWPEFRAEGALLPPVPAPRDTRAQPPRDGAWDGDEDTGEVTSDAQPPLLPGYVEEPAPTAGGAPRAQASPPTRAERTNAQAATVSQKDPSVPPMAPPSETQEVAMADLVAALGGASSSGAPSRTGPGAPSTASPARPEGADAAAVPGRAPGARGETAPPMRPEDAEELARSQRLEAQLIARQAWRELAQLYLKRADRAKDPQVRAEALTRLAEVMETELQDPAGAARMYREIVDLTGDRAALREQVRLLSARGDASLVRRALDEAIQRARTARARAGALLTRGERWLHMGEQGKAPAPTSRRRRRSRG
ncbi:tetratricopeptide repeat protein, partial [Pyxidicoccus sp. 3LG]